MAERPSRSNEALQVSGRRKSEYLLLGDHGEELYIPLPFGIRVDMKTEVTVDRRRGLLSRVVVPGMSGLVVYPPYRSETRLPSVGNVTVELVHEYVRKYEITRLLSSLHYRRAAATGLLLGAYVSGQLVGCAVVSRLRFGNPIRRREYFAKKGIRNKEKVAELPIAWVRRFATVPKFRGKGIGTLLARHVALAVPDYFRPKPEHVEVITSRTIEEMDAEGPSYKRDFLARAGYELVGNPWPEHGKWEERWNPRRHSSERVKIKSFYYIREL